MAAFKIESFKNGIVYSSFFNFLNKGLVFLNGVVVTYYLGVKTSTDIFFYLYNTVLLLGVLVTSLNASVLIPEAMRIKSSVSERNSMDLLNYFIWLYAFVLLLGIGILLIDPVQVFTIASTFERKDLEQNSMLLYLSLPLFFLVGIISLLTDILASYKFFTISMIVGIINGSTAILFVYFFHSKLQTSSVLYGFIASYVLNLLFLFFLMKRQLKWKFAWKPVKISKRIWKNLGFAQLGNFTSVVSSYMPLYILGGIGTGVITSLTFAQQFAGLPNALIIVQVSSVLGIKFNELTSKNLFTELNALFLNSAEFLLFVMMPAAGFLFFFSYDVAHLFLGSKVLGVDGMAYVSFFFKYLALLLPLFVVNTLMSRLFMATHKVAEGFWYQLIFNIVLLSVMYISVRWMGIAGYPISLLFVHGCNLLCSYILAGRFFRFIKFAVVLRKFGVLFFINAIISVTVIYLTDAVGLSNHLIRLIFAFFVYATALLTLNRVFRFSSFVDVQIKEILTRKWLMRRLKM